MHQAIRRSFVAWLEARRSEVVEAIFDRVVLDSRAGVARWSMAGLGAAIEEVMDFVLLGMKDPRTRGDGSERASSAMLDIPHAPRARECLLFLAEHPQASNSEIAAGVDIAHKSQISRLLTDLHIQDLVAKHSEGTGKRNAWQLTPRGREVTYVLVEWRSVKVRNEGSG
ncbi:MAG TPA: hypothetical protein VGL57_06785 [Solirubrobacteraceae bacterium]|jgi:DNA-binding CsgD family transcriptional regulator